MKALTPWQTLDSACAPPYRETWGFGVQTETTMPERITTFDKTCIGRRVRMRIDREPEPGEAPERVWTGKITHFDPDQPREPIIVGDISPGDNTPRRINVNRWIVEWDD